MLLMVCVCAMGTTPPYVEEVYSTDDYQRELPEPPTLCVGDGCDAFEVERSVERRLRGADSTHDADSFGGSGEEISGQAGSAPGGKMGMIRGEFSEGRPDDCELRRRADPSIVCKATPGDSSGEVDQTSGSEAGSISTSGSGSGEDTLEEKGSGQGSSVGEDAHTNRPGEGDGTGQGEPGGGDGSEQDAQGGPNGQGGGAREQGEEGQHEPGAGAGKPPEPPPEIPEQAEPEEMPEVEQDKELDILEVLKTLGLLLGITLLVIFLAAMFKGLRRRMRAKPGVDGEEEVEGAEALIEELRERTGSRPAEAWAVDLRYEEAIHALLLRAIIRTLRANPQLRSPSLTSREILERAQLSTGQHAALSTLVHAAELCIFARREASEAMYRACLSAEQELASTLRMGGGDMTREDGAADEEVLS